ncbi:hypothetical protein Q1695_012084 [Nippostrongylus brasiliensis]|nr:hypothetical protein Q1695_012084 [Nippostrongylus brasiliensis]
MEVLARSSVGTTTRQCSCLEDGECIKVMQQQGVHCANSCWRIFSQITNHPEMLFTCIATKAPVISNFIRCISENLQSCVDTMQGPQIPKVDLKMMFTVGEQRVVAARAEAIRNLAFESLRQIGDVVMKFGSCVKTCFVEEQNADGFCYDKKQCQPLVTQRNLRRALRRCLGGSSWKDHAADSCECALKAGVR